MHTRRSLGALAVTAASIAGPAFALPRSRWAVTAERLVKFAPDAIPEVREALLTTFETERQACGVDSVGQIAHLMGQMHVETAGFTKIVERLNYSANRLPAVFGIFKDKPELAADYESRGEVAIANLVYAGKNGNGDEASGDGWRFRGRGLIQLTGRDNYRIAATPEYPLESNPDLAADPVIACRLALSFWARCGAADHASKNDHARVTQAINGPAKLHMVERAYQTGCAFAYWKGIPA